MATGALLGGGTLGLIAHASMADPLFGALACVAFGVGAVGYILSDDGPGPQAQAVPGWVERELQGRKGPAADWASYESARPPRRFPLPQRQPAPCRRPARRPTRRPDGRRLAHLAGHLAA